MLLVAVAIAVLVQLSYRDSAEPIQPGPKPNGPIYFAGAPNGLYPGDASVYSVNPDGSGFKLIASAAEVGSIGHLSVSPEGKFLAYSTGGFDVFGDVYVMPLDGSGPPRRLTNDPVNVGPRGGHADYSPDWSPDGRVIVFSSSRCCDSPSGFSAFGLYTIRPNGSGLRQLANGYPNASDPAWSPDGEWIAYAGDRGSIWVAGVDGTSHHLVARTDRFVRGLAWSPDGKMIAYATTNPRHEPSAPWGSVPEDFQVHVVRVGGGGEQRPAYTCNDLCRFGGYGVEWSPDGTEIAFTFGRVRGKGIVWHIGLTRVDGGGFRVLDTHGIQPRAMSWIANG
jgi:Tol biopolymer transport system component